MSTCLSCHSPFFQEVSIQSLFSLKQSPLCMKCSSQLMLCQDGCIRCGKPTRFGSFIEEECRDCIWWRKLLGQDVLQRNQSLYEYNDFLKTLLSTYKFRGDVAIGHIFTESLLKIISEHDQQFVVTTVPLSPLRMKERGFNQADELLKRGQIHHCLMRISTDDNRKQSKKTRYERINLYQHNPFSPIPEEKSYIKGKKYLIIDDIYTTGVTVRMAAKALLESGAESVSSLTVARAI
ncbi:ComF family protein [Shouchella sp. JSM 1781072]|uniref:ComF family protein n=1 Tax=Shouchella sp. JSM 1781072 TaxID=3344581 RepID=UPI0035BEBDF1